MRKVTQTIASMEAIDFQRNQSFFSALTVAVGNLRSASKSDDKEHIDSAANSMFSLIKRRTNVKFSKLDVSSAPGEGAWVQFPITSKHSPLLSDFIRSLVPDANKGRGIKANVNGWVDLKNSKVGGAFTEIGHVLGFTKKTLTGNKLTDEEVAAVILHEIGHAFTMLEYLAQTTRRSVILANSTEEFFATKDKEKRISVLVETEKALGVDLEDTKAVLEIDDKLGSKASKVREYQCVLENAKVRKIREETGGDYYTTRSFEQLADQFSARHGATKDLVSALDKLDSFREGGYKAANYVINITQLFDVIIVSLFAGAFFTPAIGLGTVIFWLWLGSSVNVHGGPVYDTPYERLTKLRQQLVEKSKLRGITKEESEQIINEADYIESVLEAYSNNKSMFNVVGQIFWPSRRRAIKQADLQRELEQFSNNELYLDALRMKSA